MKQAGARLSGGIAVEGLKEIPREIRNVDQQRVGFSQLTKFGGEGSVKLAKVVPLWRGGRWSIRAGPPAHLESGRTGRSPRPPAGEIGADIGRGA